MPSLPRLALLAALALAAVLALPAAAAIDTDPHPHGAGQIRGEPCFGVVDTHCDEIYCPEDPQYDCMFAYCHLYVMGTCIVRYHEEIV